MFRELFSCFGKSIFEELEKISDKIFSTFSKKLFTVDEIKLGDSQNIFL